MDKKRIIELILYFGLDESLTLDEIKKDVIGHINADKKDVNFCEEKIKTIKNQIEKHTEFLNWLNKEEN